MDGGRRPLDESGQGRAMRIIEPRGLSGDLAVDEPIRTVGVETQNPVANDLETDAADLRCLAVRAAIVDRRQGEETSRFRAVLRTLRKCP